MLRARPPARRGPHDRPAGGYDFWRDYQADFWPGPQLCWVTSEPETGRACCGGPLFGRARRAGPLELPADLATAALPRADVDRRHAGQLAADRLLARPAGGRPGGRARRRTWSAARQLSLSLLYWMQTEAPRPDGGTGYPGLRLRRDVARHDDGLAKAPYIRESRRIGAELTVRGAARRGRGAAGRRPGAEFPDSVGVGSYRIDLHPRPAAGTYVDIASLPVPDPARRADPAPAGEPAAGRQEPRRHPHHQRLLPAAPGRVERRRGGRGPGRVLPRPRSSPRAVRDTPALLADFQQTLRGLDVQLAWPAEIRTRVR